MPHTQKTVAGGGSNSISSSSRASVGTTTTAAAGSQTAERLDTLDMGRKSTASISSHSLNNVRSLPKEKVLLQGVEQTLLPMVMFKYRDAQNASPILGDPYARQLLERCDVDLEASHFKFTQDERYVTWIATRAKRLDQWCQEFLDTHGNEPTTVLHLGCGLDCRYFRVRKNRQVRWIDVDMPLVVDLRSRLIPAPEGDYRLRTLSVADEGWYRDIPADRPTLVIAEGLFMYLEPDVGRRAIRDLVEYFGGGGPGQLAFDTLGSVSVLLTSYIKALRTSRSVFRWGVDEPHEIETLHPNLRLRDRVLWREFMDSHPPFFGHYGTTIASYMPSFSKNIQFWRFDFAAAGEKSTQDQDQNQNQDAAEANAPVSRPVSTASSRLRCR